MDLGLVYYWLEGDCLPEEKLEFGCWKMFLLFSLSFNELDRELNFELLLEPLADPYKLVFIGLYGLLLAGR